MSVISYTKAKIDTLLGSKQDKATLDANLASAVTPGGSATAAAIAADPALRAAYGSTTQASGAIGTLKAIATPERSAE